VTRWVSFVRGTPVNRVDPDGHAQVCLDGDEGGGCGSPGIYVPPPPTPTPTNTPTRTAGPFLKAAPTITPTPTRTVTPTTTPEFRLKPAPTKPMTAGEVVSSAVPELIEASRDYSLFRYDAGWATGTDPSSMISQGAQSTGSRLIIGAAKVYVGFVTGVGTLADLVPFLLDQAVKREEQNLELLRNWKAPYSPSYGY